MPRTPAAKPERRAAAPPAPARRLGPHDLYELCAQYPPRDVALLRAIHGRGPRILGEDFSAGAALSRAWVESGGRAVACDHDASVLDRASGLPGLVTRRCDVLRARDPVDVLFVGNFTIGEFHERSRLLAYLRHARARLQPGGIFACDLYGGVDAYQTGTLDEDRLGPGGERIRYTWEQVTACPLSARVVNAMHFRVRPSRGRAYALPRAFEYDWRLWSPPELRDALLEAGFRHVAFYHRFHHAEDDAGGVHVRPLEPGEPIEEAWFLFVVGRLGRRRGTARRSGVPTG